MTIDKAIELLKLYEHAADSILRDDFLDALKMATASLKQTQHLRRFNLAIILEALPGESWDSPST